MQERGEERGRRAALGQHLGHVVDDEADLRAAAGRAGLDDVATAVRALGPGVRVDTGKTGERDIVGGRAAPEAESAEAPASA